MEKNYNAPEINVVNIPAEDIITTSGGGNAVLPDDEF